MKINLILQGNMIICRKKHCLIGSLILIVIGVLVILCVFYFAESDCLLKMYYVGGILSGIFAFGAFLVAVWTNCTQIKTGNLQRFETTFFNMLDLQQQITNDLVYDGNMSEDGAVSQRCQEIKGRELFRYFWETSRLESKQETNEHDFGYYNNPDNYRDGLKRLLEDFGSDEYECQIVPSYFDSYFRHLYTIVKFVHSVDFLTLKEKYKYASVLRATLSRYELIWLYYNCIYGYGVEKFKPLVEEYSLLKNIRENLLALSKNNKEILISKNKIALARDRFSYTDFEFYLTTEKGDKNKYHISAFYSKSELKNGKDLIEKWTNFLNE